MKRLCVVAGLVLGLSACKSGKEGPAAPVQNGSYMLFQINDSSPTGVIKFDVKLSFTQDGDVYNMTVEHTGSDPKVDPMKVDQQLVPEENVISAFGLGRLWLPPEGRAVGKVTPCGKVQKQQTYKQWKVWKVDGLCGTSHGSRYYEENTGMLVGFMYTGGLDRNGYLKDSR